MANFMKMMKQAADMQKNMAQAQESLAAIELEHSSGGGAVTVKITGDGNITAIRLDPKALEGGDVEMLQDLILAAVNEAGRIARETMDREMSNISGGIKLPGLF